MTPVPLASLTPDDRARLLALNNAHARETSHLEPGDWERLSAAATLALGLEGGAGFVLALDRDSGHDSPNFLWFRERYERFLYVDRVVVDPAHRGRGIARALYSRVLDHARAAGLGRVTCEVNRVPPNPGSDAFHAALGFEEVGRASPGAGKVVRYLARETGR